MGEQDPAPGSIPGPTPTPRPGDTDPFEDDTPPLRPDGEPTPLGMDPGQVDVSAIPLPPGPAPPPPPPPPCQPQPPPKPPMPPRRDPMPPPTPGHRTPPGGEPDPPPSRKLETKTVRGKTWDIPLQADKEAETEMTALPLVVMEETVVMGTVQRAVAAGTAAKIEMATMMMRMKSPDAVAQEQAAHRQAERGMPPRRTKLLRQKKCRQRTPKRRDHSHPATWQRGKQEKRKDASTQVSGNPPGQGAIYRPLPEESDTVPECG